MNPLQRRLLALILLLAIAPGSGASAHAETPAVSEYAVKSALFFKLPQFVYRPSGDTPTLDICVLGGNPFGGALEKLARQPIDGRPVTLRRLKGTPEAANCDYLFITRSEAANLDTVLRGLLTTPVVTVSDIEGFAKAGGMVEMANAGEGASVSILINRRAARRLNIEFNAQLLRLAKVVEP